MFGKTLGFFLFFISFSFAQNPIALAVMDLDAEGISASENRIISTRLRSELTETKKFTVVEREKVEEILKEQGFQLSGCTSNECAVQAGKLIGVKYIAVGSIGKLGAIFTINLRLINVETGVVVKTAVEDCRCRIDKVLTHAVKRAAQKLAGNIPNTKVTEMQRNGSNSPPPSSPKKSAYQLPKYNPQKKPKQKSRFYIGAGYGNGRYTLDSRLGLQNNVDAVLTPIYEFGIGLRVVENLWLGYTLKKHRFNQVTNSDRYTGELLMQYPRIQYYFWKWLHFSYGYVFKELSFKRTPTGISLPLSKTFFNDTPLNLLSLGATIKLGRRFAVNIELSGAKNYLTAGYSLYLMF